MPLNSGRVLFFLLRYQKNMMPSNYPREGSGVRVGCRCHVFNCTVIVMAAHRQRGDTRICSMDASRPNSASPRSNVNSMDTQRPFQRYEGGSALWINSATTSGNSARQSLTRVIVDQPPPSPLPYRPLNHPANVVIHHKSQSFKKLPVCRLQWILQFEVARLEIAKRLKIQESRKRQEVQRNKTVKNCEKS